MPGFCQEAGSPLVTAQGGPGVRHPPSAPPETRPDRSDGAQLRSPAPRDRTPERPDPVPSHPRPALAGASPRSVHPHTPLAGFLKMSRRRLAVGTVLLSMMLVVVHDLPASATTLPEPAPVVEGQALTLTSATLAASDATAPVVEARDDFAMSYFTPIQWPIDPDSPVSSFFGHRAAPCAGCSTEHSGVDFTPGYGTPVHAIADGVVVSRPMSGWGTYVVIAHQVDGRTVYSGYAHMVTGSAVPVGTVVRRGEVIGRVGSTGESSGAHLHLSIIVGDTFVDPLPWMRSHVTEAWDPTAG